MKPFPKKMRIVVLYNEVHATDAPDERDVLDQVSAVSEALAKLGHQPVPLSCGLNLLDLKQRLAALEPDMAFNLVESLDGRGRLIGVIPCLLDGLGLPYTGASSAAMVETSHKIRAKERLCEAGLASPPWIGPWPHESCTRLTLPDNVPWPRGPWIIKSVWEHASLGIGDDALVFVDNAEDLMPILQERASGLGGSCFAEPYIDGREFNLSMIGGTDGPQVLPCAEILFEGFEKNRPRIVCYKAKWDAASFEYAHTTRRFDFPEIDAMLLDRLREAARNCWRIFHLHGYARVDFRVDLQNRPWILEVNANPCLSKDAGFAAAAARAGMDVTHAVEKILSDTSAGGKKPLSTPQVTGVRKDPIKNSHQARELADTVFRYVPKAQDALDVRSLVTATGFFHPCETEVAVELVQDRLTKGDASDYHFAFVEKSGRLAGYACYGPIPCTLHGVDLYWIVVHPDFQGRGLGRALALEAERLAAQAGGRRIYVETSQSEAYAPTRAFYRSLGYVFEAALTDFYGPGDGKLIGSKPLPNVRVDEKDSASWNQ